MAKILITSGPTRQYLDPVRYLTNASSGRMGAALAQAALDRGHDVSIVSGPVTVDYPEACEILAVITTEEMLEACRRVFPTCQGMIGVAAPCDYRPVLVHAQKIAKTGQPLELRLEETPDIVATLGREKQPHQWLVGFALETDDQHFRAVTKMQKKSCDLMVLNGPSAMNAVDNDVQILAHGGHILASVRGDKAEVARRILAVIEERLISRHRR